MFVIDILAYPVVYTVLIICVGGPILCGLYFLYGAFFISLSNAVVVYVNEEWILPAVPTTSDRNWDIIIATICILAGIGSLAQSSLKVSLKESFKDSFCHVSRGSPASGVSWHCNQKHHRSSGCKRKSITFVIVAVKATIRVLYDARGSSRSEQLFCLDVC